MPATAQTATSSRTAMETTTTSSMARSCLRPPSATSRIRVSDVGVSRGLHGAQVENGLGTVRSVEVVGSSPITSTDAGRGARSAAGGME